MYVSGGLGYRVLRARAAYGGKFCRCALCSPTVRGGRPLGRPFPTVPTRAETTAVRTPSEAVRRQNILLLCLSLRDVSGSSLTFSTLG